MARRTDWSTLITLIGMFAVAVVFWNTAPLYPIKLFVVLLHELGHGLAAILTGGHVERIEINHDLGGVCWSSGGTRWVILPAGYLGSMLFGGMILVGASRTRLAKLLAMGLGVMTLALVGLFVRNLFGIFFGAAFGVTLIGAGRFLSPKVNELLLKFLGLTSCLYAVIDIKEDLDAGTVPGSDAYQMSREFFLPPWFWGLLWTGIAIVVTGLLIRVAVLRSR